MKLYIITLVMLLSFSCKEKKIDPIQPNTNLDIVWKKPYADLVNGSISPVLHDGNIIFSKLKSAHTELTSYDKLNGNIEWQNLFTNIGDGNHVQSTAKSNNYLGMSSGGRLISVNLENGEEQWNFSTNETYSCYRVSAIGENLYFIRDRGLQTAQLSKTKGDALNWETVFYLENENGYPPALEMPSLYVAENNDSILIFQNRTFGFTSSQKERVDLYAFNTTTNNIEWRLDSITPTGGSSVHLPLVVGDKVYFEGSTAVFCIDIPSGEILWEYIDDSNALTSCNLVYAEDKIIVNAYTGTLFALDANTGSLIWKKEDVGHTVLNMEYYNGHVFYGSEGTGKLFAVQVSDGDIKWSEYPPGQTSAFLTQHAFTDGVTIDQETGYLYTNDGFNVMCIKIPDDL